ncbi:cytochrome C biogenesis protein [candidate division KSB3 bacterium]|uniref:Cytochrome C biogenesis protein n=1 Tax=candidate division KSB3 bacterium TaxID=2044937 RepID=A0A2G6E5I5_9BACT|nr:MAG: cytochrome C biogenesis protein [candidate division KSB3 bacterium]PIE29662.1 MAG: cytochrome C biogenesis protein [candidate division KSB3 bacterium]
MITEEISMFAAFFAGILSFLSPCVLPLVPAYISFMSGVSVDDLRQSENRRGVLKKTLLTSLAFVIGFTVVFVALGATATTVGEFLLTRIQFISKIAGIVIIVLGLHFLGLFKRALGFLNYEKRFHVQKVQAGAAGAFVIGLAFAFGWTPCVGPILGPILFLAGGQETVGKGILLLTAYSLGLGIPFLLTAVATQKFLHIFDKVKRHFQLIEILSGLFLILVGVLIFSGKFAVVTAKLIEWFPWLMNLS